MSTPETFAKSPKVEKRFVFPDPPEDPEEPTLLHLIKEIHKKYPQDDWDDIPTDAAKNLHYYLYGRPKVDD